MKDLALELILKQRHKGTRKWLISYLVQTDVKALFLFKVKWPKNKSF